jgi:death-on-curing protein
MIREFGGVQGLRDVNLLESALRRPINKWNYQKPEPDLAELAAAYIWGIVRNHPFVDGNKRTAYVVFRSFLMMNGWDVSATQDEKYDMTHGIAAGTYSEIEVSEWIRFFMVKIDGGQL